MSVKSIIFSQKQTGVVGGLYPQIMFKGVLSRSTNMFISSMSDEGSEYRCLN